MNCKSACGNVNLVHFLFIILLIRFERCQPFAVAQTVVLRVLLSIFCRRNLPAEAMVDTISFAPSSKFLLITEIVSVVVTTTNSEDRILPGFPVGTEAGTYRG